MSEVLLQAYSASRYVAIVDGVEVEFRVGKEHPTIAAWVMLNKADAGVFLTACNPQSQVLAAEVNAARAKSLQLELDAGGYPWVPGYGEDDHGEWEREISVLVSGIPRHEADRLAARYGQKAYLWIDHAGRAELVDEGQY